MSSFTNIGNSITFTSNTTGNVTIEISSQITGSGTYTVNPYIDLDNFGLSWEDLVTVSVNSCESSQNYIYGFNTQERENEIYGEGNSFSAEFWQYDGRLGKRWNIDPVLKDYESPYSCFSDNPIYYIDVKGDDKNSRHLDPDGKIIADYGDDKDNNVYKHQTARTKEEVDKWRAHFNNTSGNGVKVGALNILLLDGIESYNPSRSYYSTKQFQPRMVNKRSFSFTNSLKGNESKTNVSTTKTKRSTTTVSWGGWPQITCNLEAWAGFKINTKVVDATIGTGTPIIGFKDNDFFLLGNNLNSGEVEKYDQYGFNTVAPGINYFSMASNGAGNGAYYTKNYKRVSNNWVKTSEEIEAKIFLFTSWKEVKYPNGDNEFTVYLDLSAAIGFGLAGNGGIKFPIVSSNNTSTE